MMPHYASSFRQVTPPDKHYRQVLEVIAACRGEDPEALRYISYLISQLVDRSITLN